MSRPTNKKERQDVKIKKAESMYNKKPVSYAIGDTVIFIIDINNTSCSSKDIFYNEHGNYYYTYSRPKEGKYKIIKSESLSNGYEHIKRRYKKISNRKIRREREVSSGNNYRKHFNYWNNIL